MPADVRLSDKYELPSGRVYMTGTQALVRMLLAQKARDEAAGLNTGGFVSGYRGSPLGAVDQELWKAHIINFPTKDHRRGASKIEFVRDGLVDLVAQVRHLGIRSIAIPPLGCGNGGLDWADVRPLIEAAFEAVPEVEVRLFEPAGAPDPKTIEVCTKRPRMTSGRAAIVKVLDTYRELNYGTGGPR